MINDTIAGVSTAVGNSGISIIRLSGPSAFEITDSLFKGKKTVQEQKSHTLQYGKILSPETGEILDEVLLSKMAAPKTYTREDVVELNCHGGYTITSTILSLLYKQGARPAEPGEFTKRAFLNGRIDLAQAEAVMDIIQARTDKGSKVAVKQLEGSLSHRLDEIREKLITLLAQIEVNLDYPEYDAEEITLARAEEETNEIINNLEALLSSFHFGKILREGMEVVIAGRPNVGKSALMNRLVRKNRSIVTDIPGTTRDIIEEYINIRGVPVKLVDTAGVRETEDRVEQLGVERSLKALTDADYVVVLVDASSPLQDEDKKVLVQVSAGDKPFIQVFNKMDLVKDEEDKKALKEENPNALFLSVLEDKGVEDLEERIFKFATENNQDLDNQILITNTRHEHQLKKAKSFLEAVIRAIHHDMTLDMVALDLKSALEELGRITGHHADEDVVNAIFSRFCLGK